MNILIDKDIEMDEILNEYKFNMKKTLDQLERITPRIEENNDEKYNHAKQVIKKLCHEPVRTYLINRKLYNDDYSKLAELKRRRKGVHYKIFDMPHGIYNSYIKPIFSKGLLTFKIGYELYKSMIGSFLILFVEQKCNGHNCTILENIHTGNISYDIGLITNFITFFTFLIMYSVSFYREIQLSKDLTITKFSPGILGIHYNQDDEIKSIDKKITLYNNPKFVQYENHPIYNNKITNKIIKKISFYNYIFKITGFSTCIIFTFNLIFSSIIILVNNHYQKTFFSLLNNILLMAPNIYDIYLIITNEFSPTLSIHWKTFSEYNNYSNKNFDAIIEEIKEIRKKYMEENNLDYKDFNMITFNYGY